MHCLHHIISRGCICSHLSLVSGMPLTPHDVTADCKLLLVWHVTSVKTLPIHAFTEATLKLLRPVQSLMSDARGKAQGRANRACDCICHLLHHALSCAFVRCVNKCVIESKQQIQHYMREVCCLSCSESVTKPLMHNRMTCAYI